MRKVLTIILLAATLLVGCGNDDVCMRSHEEWVEPYTTTTYIWIGKVMVPQTHHHGGHYKTVCDEWATPTPEA